MPLANISAAPSEETQAAFDFSHYQDHLEIAQSLGLPPYPIYPAASKDLAWKRQHQAMHDEMNKALLTNGQDLTGDIDPSWYYQNYREHSDARQQLGI